jgi:hypothetical protein
MRSFTPFELWYGRDEPPVETRLLRAGPVTALLEGQDLRFVRAGGVEIVRRLYVAVRDHNWNTLAGEASEMTVEAGADRFVVRFAVRHRRGDVDFAWRGEFVGAADGTITCTMDGRAESAFRYNRIGFCVLHPMEHAGRPYRGQTPDGPIDGELPSLIGVQRIEGGQIFALFPAVERLTIDLEGGLSAGFAFEGDLFEMEDQRNWTDGSFKTYSTPLALPWPKDATPGQAIRQRVTISVQGATPKSADDGAPRLTLGEPLGRRLPPLGLGAAGHGRSLTPREVERLRAVRPSHLRLDLRPGDPDAAEALARARQDCDALGCPLALAVLLSDDAEAELARLATLLGAGAPVARVLAFHAQNRSGPRTESSTGPLVELARRLLGPVVGAAEFAGGTNLYFTELNRTRPDIAAMDAVAYSINPQVHAFDETSLIETLAAQAETVASARAFCGDRRLLVGPVTLRPRFNANATGPAAPTPPGELPASVDPRQMSLFGAAWTLGSVKYLAESGADALTYYETTGWRGLMEAEDGPTLPERFPSSAGMVFPLYHVLADLAEWREADLLACRSSDPLAVVGLAACDAEGLHLLVANLTPIERTVAIGPLPAGEIMLRRLNAASAPQALFEPDAFRAARDTVETSGDELSLTLAPYEVLRLGAAAERRRG